MGILKIIYVRIKLQMFAWKYRQSIDNVTKLYIALYTNFQMTKIFLKRCKDKNKDFDSEFKSLMQAKNKIETVVNSVIECD